MTAVTSATDRVPVVCVVVRPTGDSVASTLQETAVVVDSSLGATRCTRVILSELVLNAPTDRIVIDRTQIDSGVVGVR